LLDRFAIHSIAAIALACAAFASPARDLTLAETEAQFRAHNRELLAARRSVESAQAGQLAAAARPNPSLSLNSVDISRSPGVGPGPLRDKRIDTTLRIDQPIERGDKRTLRMDAASHLELAARDDSLDTLRVQLAQLRGAYYDLKQAQDKVAILDETAQLYARTLAAAQARLKAGDIAAADAAKVELDYDRAQNDALAARAERTRNALALGYMIGGDVDAASLRAVDPWPAERPDPAAVESAIDSYVDARPDVLAAKARVVAADKLRDLARSQRTRDVTLGAQIEHYPGTMPENSIGIGVSVPLFTGNDFSGDIQRAEVERYAALDALQKARAVAGDEIRRAASDLGAAAARLQRYDTTLLGAAVRSAQAAEFAFRRGASSVLDVLDARRTLRAVQLEALAARVDYAKALAAWHASLAGADALSTEQAEERR